MSSVSRRIATLPVLAMLLLAAGCGGKSSPPPPPGPPGPLGDGSSAWQLFTPGQYVAGTLTVAYPNLLAGERLMVLLLNADGQDRGQATVAVVGTGLPDLAPVTPPGALALGQAAAPDGRADGSGAQRGEALVMALREETARRRRNGELQRVVQAAPPRAAGAAGPAALLAPLPDTHDFCQLRYSDTAITPFWLPATLAYQTAHAAFYYTDEVKAGVDAAVASRAADTTLAAGVVPFWGELGAAYESKILPALTSHFGAPSDVDGNGKVVFLLANLGQQNQAYVMGYFWDGDIDLPLADATSCLRSTAGNRTDMLYLMDPANFQTLSGSTGDVGIKSLVETEYPSVMAHELQHDVNYITRCPTGAACGVAEEVWLNEGLSMLSMTVAGYGLHEAGARADVRYYQGEVESASKLPYHRAYSLTIWEASPYGNYAGVQAYMQYLLDHATPALSRALENPLLAGKANIEAATGLPWEVGFARFVTATVFSNEDQAEPNGGAGLVTSAGNQLAQPIFNFLGDGVAPDFVPWHHYTGYCTTPADGVRHDKQRLAYVATVPLAASSTVPLRRDGWTALATGPGAGGPATITVQSSSSQKPHVVVVKYSGALPNYTPPVTTCP